MAYTMTESPVGYDAAPKYMRYRGLRKGSTRSDYDAQVASRNTDYNKTIERDALRYRELRQMNDPEEIPLLLAPEDSSITAIKQQPFSGDQGDNSRRMGNIGYDELNQAQQKAYEQLTGTVDPLQDIREAGIDGQKERNMDESNVEEIRWNPAEIYDEYAGNQQPSEEAVINSVHEANPKDKALSYGLPSNPRPDPHRRNPSMAKSERPDVHYCNASIGSNGVTDSHYRNQSIDQKWTADLPQRNVSITRNGNSTPYHFERNDTPESHHRNPSIGRNNVPDQHYRNPSVERSNVPDSYRRNPSIERNEISSTQNDTMSYRTQDPYRINEVADIYQRKPSDSERKGSADSHKGSSSSQTRPPISKMHPSLSDIGRSGSRIATRRVKVTCDQISFTLSFTPPTTAKDILNMARDRLGEGFDQKRYALVESYRQLGAERPLRHFERIGDVLDTWDSDDKDALLIQPLHTQWEHESLDLENAPKLVPSNMTANLYYSHRPESWHKWSFTLRVDGQIVMQKYSGGDYKAICHMNEFDIYIPTSRQMKKLAPPRKFCFAIKSQQKATLSADASNFIHFFSTSDKDVASEWYRAVHGWRSHYIAHNKKAGKPWSMPATKSSYSASPPRRNASLPESSLRKNSAEKPLPRLDQALISAKNDEYRPLDTPDGTDGRYAIPNHNRSISVDRYKGSAWTRPQLPTVFTGPFNGTGLPESVRIPRKESQGIMSDTVSSVGRLPERSQTMRKQSSEPAPFTAGAVVHPYRYGKPSVDLTRDRKLSDDLNGDSSAGVSAPVGWKFDPYTGQPLTAIVPTAFNIFSDQQSTSQSMQKYADTDIYGRVQPTDRKFSYETSINDPNPYGNSDYYVPESTPAKQDAHKPSIQSERIYEITTRTGERFF